MITFLQPIKSGDKGADVLAVRLAMRAMGHPKLAKRGRRAGKEWCVTLKAVQRHHQLKADGVYGPKTHAIIAPRMTDWARWLYKHAHLRKPPLPYFSAQAAAQKLLTYAREGKLHDEGWHSCLAQLQATAAGKPVLGAIGYVHINKLVLDTLIWLIEQGHRLGISSLVVGHPYDGPHGHCGGNACDISSFDGVAVSSSLGRSKTLELAKLVHSAPGLLHPWQLICGGYGYHRDSEISAESIPAADSFYSSATMAAHTNHLHFGDL